MIVMTYLNNYQMGSQAHSILENKIIKEDRVNRFVTKVYWKIDFTGKDRGDYLLLQKAVGQYKKLIEIKEEV